MLLMTMHDTPQHLTTLELEQGIADVLESPSNEGCVVAIFVRPASDERQELTEATLTPEGGIDGDRWVHDDYYRVKGKQPDPRAQVSLMNSRYLRHIAGSEDAMCLAGDNLIVDLDLSEANVPAGSRLQVGERVVLEISDVAHTGCSKFERRYGKEAKVFTNNPRGKELHLRGLYARIIVGGTIKVGDVAHKLESP